MFCSSSIFFSQTLFFCCGCFVCAREFYFLVVIIPNHKHTHEYVYPLHIYAFYPMVQLGDKGVEGIVVGNWIKKFYNELEMKMQSLRSSSVCNVFDALTTIHFRSIQFFHAVINLVKFYIVSCCWCWCCWCCVFLFSNSWCSIWFAAVESFVLCFLSLLHIYMLSLALRHPMWYYPKIVVLYTHTHAHTLISNNRIGFVREMYDFQCHSLFPVAPHCLDIVPQTASYAFVKFKLTWHSTSTEKCCVISDVLQKSKSHRII